MLKAQPENVKPEVHPPENFRPIWAKISARLRTEVGDAIYSSWFQALEVDDIVDDIVYLSVPTKFLKSWIQAHYWDRLRTTTIQGFPGVRDIALRLRAATRLSGACKDGSRQTGVAEQSGRSSQLISTDGKAGRYGGEIVEDFGGAALDKRFSLPNFFVGPSNQLAHSAALQVVNAASGVLGVFNPLYIFSNVGLGKTHLIQGIAQATVERGKRAVYLTAEKFMYSFVSALKKQNSIAFKEKMRSIELLVIDDVQFLQGKTIQHEFCHILNSLIDSGRQVVIAGDRPPSELENLDDRVRSRFAGGLCVEISALDEALRREILCARIENVRMTHSGFEVDQAVISLVARLIDTNGRDLDGAVNRLLAHTILAGSKLSVDAAEAAIRDLVRVREPKRVRIEDIQKLVATHFNVSRADILSSRRTANVVRPRQIAMYLAKTMTLRSLPEIGRRFGGRDHTTVLHAVRKIEDLVAKDQTLNQELELLKRLLND